MSRPVLTRQLLCRHLSSAGVLVNDSLSVDLFKDFIKAPQSSDLVCSSHRVDVTRFFPGRPPFRRLQRLNMFCFIIAAISEELSH